MKLDKLKKQISIAAFRNVINKPGYIIVNGQATNIIPAQPMLSC